MKVQLTSLASFKLEKLLTYLEEEWSLHSKNKLLKKMEAKLAQSRNVAWLYRQTAVSGMQKRR